MSPDDEDIDNADNVNENKHLRSYNNDNNKFLRGYRKNF